jgi:hypothetical protein
MKVTVTDRNTVWKIGAKNFYFTIVLLTVNVPPFYFIGVTQQEEATEISVTSVVSRVKSTLRDM